MRPVQRPDPNTKKPKLSAPPGACDTHLHVYGPFDSYPLVAERNYDPDPHSTLDDYLKVHRALGLERAVIVTGSANGTNNRVTLDALARMSGKFKGLALLDSAITDAELLRLKSGGITGFRVKANGKGGLPFADAKRISTRVTDFAWHVEFLAQSMAEIIHAVPFLSSLNMPYVFDHVAHAEPSDSKDDHEFRELLSVLKNEEHAWINLYSFYQLSKSGPPEYLDMADVIHEIITAAAGRVVWGTNWPHAGISVPMPNDGDLLDFLLTVAPDERIRNSILADNPATLYGWPISKT
jgi:predicted TIM-barrel fold metal-dependent hydrolase